MHRGKNRGRLKPYKLETRKTKGMRISLKTPPRDRVGTSEELSSRKNIRFGDKSTERAGGCGRDRMKEIMLPQLGGEQNSASRHAPGSGTDGHLDWGSLKARTDDRT